MGRRKEIITVEIDKVKTIKRISRSQFGKAGQGRKTSHTDRKKKADRGACRGPLPPEEE